MARVGSIVIVCLLFTASPAAAQSSDVFREEAPPPAASPPPRVAPRPRPAPEPEPQVAVPVPAPPVQPAVAPAPSLPSATQLWARIRQVAQTEGISVPLAGTPPFDLQGTPVQYRALLGAWGPGMWQGNPAGDKAMLVIQSVDADGVLHAVVGKSAGQAIPRMWTMSTSPVAAGDRFALTVNISTPRTLGGVMQFAEDWQIQLHPDGTLYGARDNGASTIVLQRLQ